MRLGLSAGEPDGMAGDLAGKACTGQAGQPFLPQGWLGIRRREGAKAALAAKDQRGGEIVGHIVLSERGACHLGCHALVGQMRERGSDGAARAAQTSGAGLREERVIHHASLHQPRGNGGGLLVGGHGGSGDGLAILALLRGRSGPAADAVAQHAAQPGLRGGEAGQVGQGGFAQGGFGDFAHRAGCSQQGRAPGRSKFNLLR